MKKVTIILTGVILMTIGTLSVNAQSSATSANTASANIIKIITISEEAELNFGDIVPSEDLGTVVIAPAGVRSFTGGVTLLNGYLTVHSAAEFSVTGDNNKTFIITLPNNTEIKLSKADGEDMDVTNFTHNSTLTTDVNGDASFNVGATLNVNADQAPGLYTGAYDVTVAYN
jgi:hypothetical protein